MGPHVVRTTRRGLYGPGRTRASDFTAQEAEVREVASYYDEDERRVVRHRNVREGKEKWQPLGESNPCLMAENHPS